MMNYFTHFTHAFPDKCVKNTDPPFNKWPEKCKTAGVEQRYMATTETIEDLAKKAVQNLFNRLQSQPACTALVLASSRKSIELFCLQQLANEVAAAFDIRVAKGINFACSGFSAAVSRALELREQHDHVAVVCAEVASYSLDYNDPATAILFGDGAGATSISSSGFHRILSAWVEEFANTSCDMGTKKGYYTNANGESTQRNVFTMSGKATMKAAALTLADTIIEARDSYPDSPMVIVPHQASMPVLTLLQRQLERRGLQVPIVCDVKDGGNLASASVPVALARNVSNIAPGTLVLCPTVGGGANLEHGKMSKGLVAFWKDDGANTSI